MKLAILIAALIVGTASAMAQDDLAEIVPPHPTEYAAQIKINLQAVAVDTNSEAYQFQLLLAKYKPLNPPFSAWQAFALQFPNPHTNSLTLHLGTLSASNVVVQYSYNMVDWLDLPPWPANMPDGHTLSITTDAAQCFYRLKGTP